MSGEQIERRRPYLREDGYALTSPESPVYNCFAWAAGDTESWWQPADPLLEPFPGRSYWPPGAPNTFTIEAFLLAFASLGYEECETADREPGFEKVAIYADDTGEPTHAARQLESGAWTSKLGEWGDIEHNTVRGVEGPAYGRAARFLKRQRR